MIGAWLVLLACWSDPMDAIEAGFVDPYAALLAADADADAWQRMTTPGFQARHAEVVYRVARARSEEEFGDVVRIEVLSEAPETVTDEDGTRVHRVVVRHVGAKATTRAVLDLIAGEDGTYRLHRAWWWPEGQLATERIL